MSDPHLQHCPFCGFDDPVIDRIGRGYTGTAFWAQCDHCGAEGPVANTREEAAKRWNSRWPEARGKGNKDPGRYPSVKAWEADLSSPDKYRPGDDAVIGGLPAGEDLPSGGVNLEDQP